MAEWKNLEISAKLFTNIQESCLSKNGAALENAFANEGGGFTRFPGLDAFATLTGAVGGALGDDYAGLFSRHDALADQLTAASTVTGEGLWRLPLHSTYAQDTSSTIADIKNSGDGGAGAGTGAWFIGEFVSRDIPWAHLDIANMAYGGANDWKPAGSAGFAVRLLEQFVRDWTPVEKGAADGGR